MKKQMNEEYMGAESGFPENYDKAVNEIKEAILKSQYQAAKGVNCIQLSLYFGIGKYLSENTRSGAWGKGAIRSISEKLKRILPGLRGFSESNLKNMRQFYEAWEGALSKSPAMAGEIETNSKSIDTEMLLPVKSPAVAGDFNLQEFLAVGFSHHMEILNKTETIAERIFYIHHSVVHQWNKYMLRECLKQKLYEHQGVLANNFYESIQEEQSALKAIEMFKDEYLLDYINVEELDARDAQDVDERVVENAIIHNVKNFLMTFGKDFAFIGNQYHLEKFGVNHWCDLLFFN